MKLIKLTMKYFGPFEHEVIDFRTLNNKLFLISGKTGSGKTMIFDGIVTALYGSPSTKGRDEESLRSQFAPADSPSEVQLIFEVKNKQYIVKRVLKYKKPGNKSETPAKAVLHGPDGNIIAGKLTDVRQAVEDIIKLTRDQFRKILILPQGEFKELLVSSSQEKQDILRTLFQTERFLNFEMKLREELKAKGQETDKLDTKIQESIKQLHTEDVEITREEEFASHQDIVIYLDKISDQYKKKLLNLEVDGKKKSEEYNQLSDALIKKQDHNEQVKELERYKAQEQNINAKKSQMEEYRTLIDDYDKVSEIKYELQRRIELVKSIDEHKNKIRSSKKSIKSYQEDLAGLKKSLDSYYQDEAQMKDREKIFYQNERFLSEDYQSLNDEIKQVTDKINELNDKSARLKDDIESKKNDYEKIEIDQEVLFDIKSKIQNKDHELTALKRDLDESKKIETYTEEKEELKSQLGKNYGYLSELREELSQFSKEFNSYDDDTFATINHLIAHLEVGIACPVCKQTVLDLPEGGLLSEEDKVTFNQLQDDIKKTEETNQKLVNRMDVMEELLRDNTLQPSAVIKDQVASNEEKLAKLNEEYQKEESRLQAKNKLQEEITSNENAYSDLLRDEDKLKNELKILKEKHKDFTTKTNFDNYQELSDFMDKERASIMEFNEAFTKYKDEYSQKNSDLKVEETKQSALVDNKEALEKEDKTISQTIKAFKNAQDIKDDSVLYRLINDKTISDKKKELKAFDEEYASVTRQIQLLEDKVESLEIFDLTKDQEHLETSKVALDQLREFYGSIKTRQETNDKIKDYLTTLIDDYGRSHKYYLDLKELVDAVQGKLGYKVSLERYVLIYYLERILDLANYRLLSMTNHRYKLIRSTKKSNRYSGLDIEVFDYYNNQSRNINSLSGGETFQASLVLALALNESLQEEAGGIQLDTMLIDEGFGTLDQETLEVAISTLIDLQTTGKTVGIISHVEELKLRMENILTVIPENGRSRTKIHSL